jgi:HEPN domain-containing protein
MKWSRRMGLRADTENWIATAEYDLETAHHMLATKRYIYVVFFCHLAVEKLLKAHVTEVTQAIPLKTHDLAVLLKVSGIQIPQQHLAIVGTLNTASVPTRYPDDLQKMLGLYTRAKVQDYLKRTKELMAWLRQHPNLQK